MDRYIAVFILLIVLFSCSSAFSFQFKAYDGRGVLSDAEGEGVKSSQQAGVKKWLMLSGAFAAPAFLYLILLGVSGGGFLPEKLENILAKVCAGIILTTAFIFLYYMTANPVFFVMVFMALGFILYATIGAPVYNRLQRRYVIKYGRPSSEDAWICRSCGEENLKLYAECQRCGARNSSEPEEPSSGDIWVCTECGWKNNLSDKTCNRCGYRREGQ